MALIQCAECGHQVSDKAITCPKCGNPIQEQINNEKSMDQVIRYCPQCGVSGTKIWWKRDIIAGNCFFCFSDRVVTSPYTKREILQMRNEEDSSLYDPKNPDPINDWIVRHCASREPDHRPLSYTGRLNRSARDNISESTIDIAVARERQQQQDYRNQQVAAGKMCPHCHSNLVTKISTLGRAASVSLFGLASSTIGKTMQCHSCGYKW